MLIIDFPPSPPFIKKYRPDLIKDIGRLGAVWEGANREEGLSSPTALQGKYRS